MDFLKIYRARKLLHLAPTSFAATSPKPDKGLVFEYADKSEKITFSAIQSKQLKIAHLKFDVKPAQIYTILTRACSMVFIVSLQGAARIQFPDKRKVVLAKETCLLYFSASEKIEVTTHSPLLSLVLFGGKAQRTILPLRFQLLEDFFLKINTGSSVFLFPGAYPLSILSIQDVQLLFGKNVNGPLTETIFRVIMARELEIRTKAYKVSSAVKTTAKRDEAIFEVVEKILLHLEDSYSVDALAAQIFTNPNSLNKRFRQTTGQSVFSFLRQTKTDRGVDLLKNSDHPIEEIAGMLGFCTKVHFARFLKRQTGMTPSQFRNNVKY